MATWLNWLGLARKAGKLAPGSHQVEMALKSGQVALIVVAEDAGTSVYRKYHLWAQDLKVPVVRAGMKVDLGSAIGMGPHAILAILDVALAKKLWMAMGKQIGGMEFGGQRQGQNPGVRTGQRTQIGQQAPDRSTAPTESRKHQEPHEHSGTRGGANGSRYHARQTASGAKTSNSKRGHGTPSVERGGSEHQPAAQHARRSQSESRQSGYPSRGGKPSPRRVTKQSSGRLREQSPGPKRSPH